MCLVPVACAAPDHGGGLLFREIEFLVDGVQRGDALADGVRISVEEGQRCPLLHGAYLLNWPSIHALHEYAVLAASIL